MVRYYKSYILIGEIVSREIILPVLNTDILAVITDERQPFICKYRFACYSEMKARMIELID